MFQFRHIAIVCKGDIAQLKEFYTALFNPSKIIISEEFGTQVEGITGITNINIVTCKIFSDKFNIELIKYNNPKVNLILNNSPAFSGFNHIALTVDDFSLAINKLLKHGGKLLGNGIPNKTSKIVNAIYATDPEGNILEIVQEV